jgi:hypothetical protein
MESKLFSAAIAAIKEKGILSELADREKSDSPSAFDEQVTISSNAL